MSDLRQASREFLIEFIELYKNFPCLWQIKNKDYSNRNKKDLAYAELVKKYKEIDPLADRSTVVKKINSFRTVYKRELNKINSSLKSGAGSDEVYKPSLWYFEHLHFLNDIEPARTSKSTLDENEEENVDHKLPETQLDENVDEPDETEMQRIESTVEPPSPATPVTVIATRIQREKPATTPKQNHPYVRPLSKKVAEQRLNKIETVVGELKAISNQVLSHDTSSVQTNCEFDMFSKFVSTQLQKLPEVEALAAMQEIQSCLFRRRIACANRSSNILQDPLRDDGDCNTNTDSTCSITKREEY